MKAISLIVAAAVIVVAFGCASKVRTTNTGRSQTDIMTLLTSTLDTAQATGNGDALTQIQNTSGVELFFAESSPENRNMGPVSVVASLDWTSLGITANMDENSLFRAFFFEVPIDQGGQGVLVLMFQGDGDPSITPKVYTSGGQSGSSVQNGEYQMDLSSGDGMTIRLVSDDLLRGSNTLADTIQLRVYDITSGSEVYLGKISTLQGYQIH